jgi:hypothetical protein
VEVFGNTRWLALLFVLIGVTISLGTGFQGMFKPAERSPGFAELAFEYERVKRELVFAIGALYRDNNSPAAETLDSGLDEALDVAARAADESLDEVRKREVALYMAGVTAMGRHRTGTARQEPRRE